MTMKNSHVTYLFWCFKGTHTVTTFIN